MEVHKIVLVVGAHTLSLVRIFSSDRKAFDRTALDWRVLQVLIDFGVLLADHSMVSKFGSSYWMKRLRSVVASSFGFHSKSGLLLP